MTAGEFIPPSNYRKGPRTSKCLDLVMAAQSSGTGKISVRSDDAAELIKLYKSMVQWKARNKDPFVRIRKDRDTLYVWVPEQDPETYPMETCPLCHQVLPIDV